MLKKLMLIITITIFSSPAFSYRHGCSLNNTVYFAFIKDHTKAIEICKVGVQYKLTFGIVGNPEIILSKSDLKITKIFYPSGSGLRIEDGLNYYEVMGQKFSDGIMRIKINNKIMYQVLDTRDENFINSIDEIVHL